MKKEEFWVDIPVSEKDAEILKAMTPYGKEERLKDWRIMRAIKKTKD